MSAIGRTDGAVAAGWSGMVACFSMPLEGSSILAPPYRTSLHHVHGKCRSQVVTSRSRRARLQRRTSTVVASSAVVDVSVSDDLSECSSAQATLVGLESDAAALLAAAVKDAETELSVLLCTDTFIRDLNAKWRGLEKATDVLSFPQEDGVVLGDVVISVDTALRQAEERNHSLQEEIRILLVHGLLHLLGYDHETSNEDLVEMAAAEQTLMTKMSWEGCGLISAAKGALPH